MLDRLYFDQSVHLLVEWDEERKTAHVRAVVYGRPDDAPHAAQLAASMSVPVQRDSGAPSPQATPTAAATQS
jgi:hypothetical protein